MNEMLKTAKNCGIMPCVKLIFWAMAYAINITKAFSYSYDVTESNTDKLSLEIHIGKHHKENVGIM